MRVWRVKSRLPPCAQLGESLYCAQNPQPLLPAEMSMTQLQAAIDHYHELCQTGDLAQESWGVLLPGMAERHILFGDRPLCTVLRPMFHTGLSWHYLSARTSL